LAFTAPLGNRVYLPPLAQIDEGYRAPQVKPVDDGPAELPSSQIVVEAYLDPFSPFQIGDPDLGADRSSAFLHRSFSAHSDEAYRRVSFRFPCVEFDAFSL
jgi:hypothetical protein